MFLQQLIERYKSMRKQKFLGLPGTYRHKYAFIGAGQHSISNLYPLLHYLGVPLKMICTVHKKNADRMAARFAACTGTGSISDIIADNTIQGVFVSATPDQHFSIVRQLMDAGKHVFVEKPPCQHIDELHQLIDHTNAHQCMAGMQKRFSLINQQLLRLRSDALNYSCRYFTGLYPEGNPLTELFIHPIDNAIYLFGEPQAIQLQDAPKGTGTWFITLLHKSGVRGVIHLSVEHSWKSAVDELLITTKKSILEARYPYLLTSIEKSPAVLNIPMEKLSSKPAIKKIYIDSNGFTPTMTHNTIAIQGFLGEIEHFLRMTENKIYDKRHHLSSLIPTYEIITRLSQS